MVCLSGDLHISGCSQPSRSAVPYSKIYRCSLLVVRSDVDLPKIGAGRLLFQDDDAMADSTTVAVCALWCCGAPRHWLGDKRQLGLTVSSLLVMMLVAF